MSNIIDIAPVDLVDTTPEFQETQLDVGEVLEQRLKDENIVGGPLEKIYNIDLIGEQKKAADIVLNNKLDIASSYIGEPVTNDDWGASDYGLVFTLERSRSFINRQRRFLKNYPEGQYIRQSVSLGNKDYELEFYKRNKNDKEFKLVEPFGFEMSDFPEAGGNVLNMQTAGEVGGMMVGTALNKLSKGLNPKSVQGLLTKAANNPALEKILNTLKASKGASKALGPVDKIITALMTLANYVGGGESPINAILKGLGGLLGYGVGFSAATASIVSFPALGAIPGLPFMGGIAGGIAGEWLAMKIAKVLAKTPLADIDDPIMGGKDIEAGLPARKLVRDPDGLLDHMIPGAKLNMDPAKGEGEGSDSKPTSLKSVPVKATPDNTKGVKSTSAQSVPTINQGGSSGSGGGSSAGGGTTSQPQEGQAAIIPMPTQQNTSTPVKSGATSSVNVEKQFTTGQMAKS